MKRDTAGDRGTLVHGLIQDVLMDQEITVPKSVEAYMAGVLDLIERAHITPVLTETSIGNRDHWYTGRFDLIGYVGAMHDQLILLDWKTSGGIYGEVALQTAAYARGEFHAVDGDDTEHPLPRVDGTAVVHVTPEGSALYPLSKTQPEIDECFEEFLAAKFIKDTQKRRDARIREPLMLDQAAA